MLKPYFVIRALDTLSDNHGMFTLIALDQRSTIYNILNEKGDPQEVQNTHIKEIKLDIIRHLAPFSSGMLLDPDIAAPAAVRHGALPGNVGLIITLEASPYRLRHDIYAPEFVQGGGPELVRSLGGVAAKLLIRYPANDAKAQREMQEFVANIYEDCHTLGLAFVLEVIIDGADNAKTFEGTLLQAAEALSPSCDIFKTAFPAYDTNDEEHAVSICQEFDSKCEVPWVLLTGGIEYPVFKRQLEIACANGASGFLAGRTIWLDSVYADNPSQRQQILKDISQVRLRECINIAHKYGTPWRQKYTHLIQIDESLTNTNSA